MPKVDIVWTEATGWKLEFPTLLVRQSLRLFEALKTNPQYPCLRRCCRNYCQTPWILIIFCSKTPDRSNVNTCYTVSQSRFGGLQRIGLSPHGWRTSQGVITLRGLLSRPACSDAAIVMPPAALLIKIHSARQWRTSLCGNKYDEAATAEAHQLKTEQGTALVPLHRETKNACKSGTTCNQAGGNCFPPKLHSIDFVNCEWFSCQMRGILWWYGIVLIFFGITYRTPIKKGGIRQSFGGRPSHIINTHTHNTYRFDPADVLRCILPCP